MKTRSWLLACGLMVTACGGNGPEPVPPPPLSDNNACTTDTRDPVTGVVTHTLIALDDGDECTTDACGPTSGPVHTPVDSVFCRGKANFNDHALAGMGGNGRSCADCHVPSERFQLTPATAMARFNAMTSSGKADPLFLPIDANDFRINGAAAHDFTNLTVNGLVRVTLPLPSNVKLLDCGATIPCPASAQPTSETVADVWRVTPSILDVNITGADVAGPVLGARAEPQGGYQLDGRIDTLQNQALSALQNHARDTGRSADELLRRPGGLREHPVLLPERQSLVRRHRRGHRPAARSGSRT